MVMNDGREMNFIKNSCLFFLKVSYQNVANPFACNKTNEASKQISFYGQIAFTGRLKHLNKTDVKRTVRCEGELKDACETCAMRKQARPPVQKKAEHKARISNSSTQTLSVLSKRLI